MSPHDAQSERDSDHQEAIESRASASDEFPTNVTRSTEDLTIGGSEKKPPSQAQASGDEHPDSPAMDEEESSPGPTEEPPAGLSSSEQAVVNQECALESGDESPG